MTHKITDKRARRDAEKARKAERAARRRDKRQTVAFFGGVA